MSQIISLMTQLNLSDEIITNTVSKITIICATNDYPMTLNRTSFHTLQGNGDGNGNGNN
jgi:hypothetical protein